MRLTKKKALDISIELWERMAKTGAKHKRTWLGWKKYGKMLNNCPLCEYVDVDKDGYLKNRCKECPLNWGYIGCEDNETSQYIKWIEDAHNPFDRKKYAGLFLEQLKEIRDK